MLNYNNELYLIAQQHLELIYKQELNMEHVMAFIFKI